MLLVSMTMVQTNDVSTRNQVSTDVSTCLNDIVIGHGRSGKLGKKIEKLGKLLKS